MKLIQEKRLARTPRGEKSAESRKWLPEDRDQDQDQDQDQNKDQGKTKISAPSQTEKS